LRSFEDKIKGQCDHDWNKIHSLLPFVCAMVFIGHNINTTRFPNVFLNQILFLVVKKLLKISIASFIIQESPKNKEKRRRKGK
jgi:hypothetical protein